MIVKRINLCALDTGSLTLGYVGENDHTQIRINCASVFADYPAAVVSMTVKAPSGVVYPREVETDGQVVIWTITDSDTASAGNGQIQLTFTEDGTIVKTVIAVTTVRASLVGDNPPPDPITDWIDEAGEALAKLEGITASATQLPAGEDPTAEVEVVDGHYNIALGIPGGDADSIIDDTAGVGDTTKVWSANKSATELSELKSDIDRKAPVINQTASGDIVSFADGADGMPISSCVVSIDPVQSGTGDPSPTNVRPITGHDSCRIAVAGTQTADGEIAFSYTQSGTGDPSTSNIRPITPGLSIVRDDSSTLTLYAGTINPATGIVTEVWRLSTPDFTGGSWNLSGTSSWWRNYSSKERGSSTAVCSHFTTTTYTSSDRIQVNSTGFTAQSDLVAYQVAQTAAGTPVQIVYKLGTPATYQLSPAETQRALTALGISGTVYPISWQTAAGTVYKGTINPLTGVLTVTWAGLILDGVTNKCEAFTDSGTSHGFALNVGNLVPYAQSTVYVESSHFKGAAYNARGDNGSDNTIFPTNSNGRLRIRYDTIEVEGTSEENIAAFNAYLVAQSNANTPVQVIYKLKTDLTYQLDPVQITALRESSIWADTGAISLTYPADTRTYVDSAIQTATDPDGNVVTVSGSTPSITGESGKRYVCGTVDSISITPPQTGIIDVVFSSGTTPTVLTVPNTVLFPGWFDPTSLDASTTYEINIQDGYGAVMAWQT